MLWQLQNFTHAADKSSLISITGFKVVRGIYPSCKEHHQKGYFMQSTSDKASFMFSKEGSVFSGTTRPVFLTKHHSPYWWQQIAALCTEVSNCHSRAARGAGTNKLIFQAGFLKPLERNIYISHQNISLLRRAVYQNEHFHSLADRPAKMLFYECAKSSSLNLFHCPC